LSQAADEDPLNAIRDTSRRTNGGGLTWSVIAVALSVAAVGVTYGLLRWASAPIATAVVALGLILIVLAVCGFLASRRAHAAPYVVAALLLPYAVAAAVVYGGTQRAADEITKVFAVSGDNSTAFATDDPSTSVKAGTDDGSDTDAGRNEDGVDTDSDGIDAGCMDADQYRGIKVGASQETLTSRLGTLGTTADGGAGGFVQSFTDCLDDTKTYYVTFGADPPNRVLEKKVG